MSMTDIRWRPFVGVFLVVGFLLVPAGSILNAQVSVGLTPAAGFYGEPALVPETVGFEGQIHVDWLPSFLPEPLRGLGLAAMGGLSMVASETEEGVELDTLGFLFGAGVLYEITLGTVVLRPGVYTGFQYSTYEGIEIDDEVLFMVQPHLEAGHTFPWGLSAGLYLGYKLLFYDDLEASLTLGPRLRYVFGHGSDGENHDGNTQESNDF